ncbi:MAG: hypothetical protein KDD60_13380, partial [Bdellovibrionales bacterium]|nr:hypothetical protein [Bdellovibrionales bacterium]
MLAKDSRKTILSEPTTDALKTYLKEVACIPPLSTEAEFDLARAAKNGNEEARKGLIRGGL